MVKTRPNNVDVYAALIWREWGRLHYSWTDPRV